MMTRKLLEQLQLTREEIKRCEQRLTQVDGTQGASVREKVLLFSQLRYYKRKRAQLLGLKLKIEQAIDRVPDPLHAMILRYKYLDLKSIEQISELLGYSPRHMQRLHGAALEEFDLLFKNPSGRAESAVRRA